MNSIKILIVDDSGLQREIIKATLLQGGYSAITEAENAINALEKVNQIIFDLIITDINMPLMNGFVFVKQLRSLDRYKRTPILVLTAEDGANMKAMGIEAGATGWIKKPIVKDTFLKAISIANRINIKQ